MNRLLIAALTLALAAPTAAQEVDGARLMEDLRILAADSMEGRLVGSEGVAAARRHIVARLEGLQVQVDSQAFPILRGDDQLRGVNLAALIPGAEGVRLQEPVFVISAHYDHVGTRDGAIFNGADDNASGAAALLAFAEALSDRPLERTVILLFFDAEEGGLRGARYFVEEAGDRIQDQIALNLNLDMVSRSERELWVAGTHQNPALKPVLEGVEPAEGVQLRFGHDSPDWVGADNWTSASDHGPFNQAGIPFLYFGVEDHPDYHRPSDTADKVDPDWYRASVETILRVTRALAAAPEAVEAARAGHRTP